MRLGMGSCPYCGNPLSTSLTVREQHFKRCPDNPDNWDEDTSWLELNDD